MTAKKLALEKLKQINIWRLSQMYDYYIADIDYQLEQIDKELREIKLNVVECVNCLKPYKKQLTKLGYSFTGQNKIQDISELPKFTINDECDKILNRIVTYNKRIEILNYDYNKIVLKKIDKKKFNFIITNANDMIIEYILDGHVFKFGHHAGELYITRIERSPSSSTTTIGKPNWKASKKLKDQLIQQGVQIRTKENPNGANWLVPKTDHFDYRIRWRKGKCRIKGKQKFHFFPTKSSTLSSGKKTFVTRLYERLENDPFAHIKYMKN